MRRKAYYAPPMFYRDLGATAPIWDAMENLMFETTYVRSKESQADARKALAEYTTWCQANAKGEWHISFMKTKETVTERASYMNGEHDRGVIDAIETIRVSFQDAKDATLFKMFNT